jgi:hypothetical protein
MLLRRRVCINSISARAAGSTVCVGKTIVEAEVGVLDIVDEFPGA